MATATALKPDGYTVRDYEGRSVTAAYVLGKAADGREVVVELLVSYNGSRDRNPNTFEAFATGPVYRTVEAEATTTTWDMLGTPRTRWEVAKAPRFSRKGLIAAVKAAVQDVEANAAKVFTAAQAAVAQEAN